MTGTDIYIAREKNLELFVQVRHDALYTGDGGISGETNPVGHRKIAKKLALAFSMRNLKAKDGAFKKNFDLFIQGRRARDRVRTQDGLVRVRHLCGHNIRPRDGPRCRIIASIWKYKILINGPNLEE